MWVYIMLFNRKNKGTVRYAKKKDLDRINALRKQLHDLHCTGKPDIFQKPFGDKLTAEIRKMYHNKDGILVVSEKDEDIQGFAYAVCYTIKDSPYWDERKYCKICEVCVDKALRGQGIGTELVEYIGKESAEKGFEKLEMEVWEFNAAACAFWEKRGFTTYLRCMERKPAAAAGEETCQQ